MTDTLKSFHPMQQHMDEAMCGCGKPVKYQVHGEPAIWACNKYMRCSTREELQLRVEELNVKLRQAKKYCNELLKIQSAWGDTNAKWIELRQFIDTLPPG